MRKRTVIALVGAGKGGSAILATLYKIPGVCIKYVCDINAKAPGIALAKQYKIRRCTTHYQSVLQKDRELDLILEVTGKPSVYHALENHKPPRCGIIGGSGTKILFHLLDKQDQVARQLEDYKQALEYGIVKKTAELERANRNLKKQVIEYERLNETLQRVNNEKTRYLLQATHQLKAPFAAIQSYVDVILEGYTGAIPSETRVVLQKTKARCEMLAGSIKEMLALANLKACVRDNIQMAVVDLGPLLRGVIDKLLAIAVQRKIQLDLRPLEPSVIRCNREQTEILFSILVENAIHYSPDHSRIEISTSTDSDSFTVTVRDHGIGISAKNLPRIFDEYFRANNAVAKHESGSGLGLAIAREISSINHFSLRVESIENEGTAFHVTAQRAVPEATRARRP